LIKQKNIFVYLILFFSLVAQSANIEITKDNLILKMGEKSFKILDEKVKKFLDGTGLVEIEQYLEAEAKKVGLGFSLGNGRCNCQKFRFLTSDWEKLMKRTLEVYPDFHKDKKIKQKRIFMTKVIDQTFRDLENDLKRWPDLLTNIEAITSRIHLKIERKIYNTLRTSQNKDGSYGDKNKVYCSSQALLSFLSFGTTTNAKYYGKHVQALIKFLSTLKEEEIGKDINIYTYAISAAYIMIGSQEIENIFEKNVPVFLKSIHWNFKGRPRDFFIQSLAMSLVERNLKDRTPTLFYFNKIKDLKDKKSYSLEASKFLWIPYKTLPTEKKKALIVALESQSSYAIDDIILYHLSFKLSDSERKSLLNRLHESSEFESKYKIDRKRFSKKELSILQGVYPEYLMAYTTYLYIPGTKYKKPSKDKIDDIPIEEIDEVLDLIE